MLKKLILLPVLLLSVIAVSGKADTADGKYIGRVIAGVEVVSDIKTGELDNLPRLRTEQGQKYDPEKINFDIHSIYSTGLFEDIQVDVVEKEEGLIVRYLLRPYYFISSVKYEGDTYFSSDVLEEQINITYLTRLRDKLLESNKIALQDFYRREGYYEAKISWSVEKDDDDRTADVIYTIDAGRPVLIRDFVLMQSEGVPASFSFDDLDNIDISDLKGERVSEELISGWVADAQNKFYENGYYTTVIQYVGEELNPESNDVTLHFNLRTDGKIEVQIDKNELGMVKLRELISTAVNRELSSDLINDWIARIEEYFRVQGYYSAKIYSARGEFAQRDPVFRKKIQSLRLVISKGLLKKFKDIRFSGNNNFTAQELSAQVLGRNWKQDQELPYNNDLKNLIIDRLIRFYRSRGYLDFNISNYELANLESADISDVFLNLNLNEGMHYKVRDIRLNGNPALPLQDVTDLIDIKPGSYYAQEDFDNAVQRLRERYTKEGLRISVDGSVVKEKNNTVALDFFFARETESYVDQIIFNGYRTTDKKFILKQLEFREGDVFTSQKILQSQLRLYDLGLFSRVEFLFLGADITQPNKRIILRVQESQPVLMTYGGGIDTENYLRGVFSISHSNLNGKAEKASFRISLGSKETSAQLSYQVPQFITQDWDLFATVFYEKHERESFGVSRGGGTIQLSKKINPKITHMISINVEKVKLFNVEISELLIPREDREASINSISSTLLADYRDDPFNPLNGFFFSSNIKWASSIFGSRESFIKGYVQNNLYFNPTGELVFAMGLRLGLSAVLEDDDVLPPSERFFAGGSNTLRAFELDTVGPKDEESGLPIGGGALIISNFELRIPLFGQFGGVLFYDIGSVFETPADIRFDELVQSVGVGLRYNTPVGPLRIDFGFNPRNFARNQFFISIGHVF